MMQHWSDLKPMWKVHSAHEDDKNASEVSKMHKPIWIMWI